VRQLRDGSAHVSERLHLGRVDVHGLGGVRRGHDGDGHAGVRRLRRRNADADSHLRSGLLVGGMERLGHVHDGDHVHGGHDRPRDACVRQLQYRNPVAHAHVQRDDLHVGRVGHVVDLQRRRCVRAGSDARGLLRSVLASGVLDELRVEHVPAPQRQRMRVAKRHALSLLRLEPLAVLPLELPVEHRLRGVQRLRLLTPVARSSAIARAPRAPSP